MFISNGRIPYGRWDLGNSGLVPLLRGQFVLDIGSHLTFFAGHFGLPPFFAGTLKLVKRTCWELGPNLTKAVGFVYRKLG